MLEGIPIQALNIQRVWERLAYSDKEIAKFALQDPRRAQHRQECGQQKIMIDFKK